MTHYISLPNSTTNYGPIASVIFTLLLVSPQDFSGLRKDRWDKILQPVSSCMYVSIHMLLPFFREHFHQRQPTISTIPATIKDTVLEANTYASILVSQDHSAANMFFVVGRINFNSGA